MQDQKDEIKKALEIYHESMKVQKMMNQTAQEVLWRNLNERLDAIFSYEPTKRDCF